MTVMDCVEKPQRAKQFWIVSIVTNFHASTAHLIAKIYKPILRYQLPVAAPAR